MSEVNKISLGGLFSEAFLALAFRAAGAVLAFGLNVAVGRLLGAEGAGLYFLSLSVVSIGAVVARMGMENTLVRFVATYVEKNDWGRARGVLRYVLKTAGLLSLALAIGITLAAPLIATWVFKEPQMTPVLRAMGIALFGYNLMTFVSEALKGLSRIPASLIVSSVVYPLVALGVIFPAAGYFGPVGAGLAYAIGTFAAAAGGWVMWRVYMRGKPPARPVPAMDIKASSRPLWTSMILLRAVQPWAPLLMLGVWGGAVDSGFFGAATRVALLVSFFLLAVNSVLAPRFAALHARGERKEIATLARRFALLATFVASPAFLAFIFAGDFVMGLFGPDFAQGGSVLAILAVGQIVNAFTGPSGVVLMMGGREKDMQILTFCSVVVLIGSGLLLIPAYGAIGAALTATTGYVFTSVSATFLVSLRFGIWVVPLPFLPSITKRTEQDFVA